jgi:hypothetical protein
MRHFNGGNPHDPIGGGINPASGLPMMGGSMFDVAGNAYGTDSMSSFGNTFDMDWSCGSDMLSGDSTFGGDW